MLAWAKHEDKTLMATKQPKSELAEPLKATRQDVTPLITLLTITKVLEAVVSAVLLPEAPLMIYLMIARSRKVS